MAAHKYVEMFMHYLPILLPLFLIYLSKFILLALALWIMIRCQSLQYNVPGLLGSAALSSAFDMLPFFGHYVAVGILLFCVLKLTRSHLIDVRFTVSISYAVMFLMQMLILTLLPTEMKAHARTPRTFHDFALLAKGEQQKDDPDNPDEDNISMTAAASGKADSTVKTNDSSATSNNVAKALPATVSSRATSEYAREFTLKGVMRNAKNSMVMVNTGSKTYSLRMGESQMMETPSGKVEVQVDEVTDTTAVLKIGGVATALRLR